MMQMGYAPDDWQGKPVIGILNTWSDLNPCHAHFKQRVEDVKRGVLQAGGFPVELPAISLSRELRQADDDALPQPAGDGDRGADPRASGRRRGADGRLRQDHARPAHGRALAPACPAIYLPAGPMLRGNWPARRSARARTPGSTGTSAAPATSAEQRVARRSRAASPASYGTCMTMGTASTMTAIAEAMGLTLPGASSIPAADANHIRMAAECGRRIVEMVWEDLTPRPDRHARPRSRTPSTVAMATGCSTNAIIHLIAMARRAGVPLDARRPRRARPHDAGDRQHPARRARAT